MGCENRDGAAHLHGDIPRSLLHRVGGAERAVPCPHGGLGHVREWRVDHVKQALILREADAERHRDHAQRDDHPRAQFVEVIDDAQVGIVGDAP